MAQLSLGESRWRMLRRVIRLKRFRYTDARNMSRKDDEHFAWMIANGFFAKLDDDEFEVTDRGRASADLGFYEV